MPLMTLTRRRSERVQAFNTNSSSVATGNCKNPPESQQGTASVPSPTGSCDEDKDSGQQPLSKRRRTQQKPVCKVSAKYTRIQPTKSQNGRRKSATQEPVSDAVENENILPPLPDLMEEPLTPFTNDEDDDDNDDALPRFDFVPDEKFEEGDLIWVKLGRDPHWPAVALKLVKRRERLLRVRVRFIEFDESDKLLHKPLSLSYNSTRMQPISKDYDARKNGQMPDDVSRRFKKAMERVERFLFSCSQPNVRATDYFGATEESPALTERGDGSGRGETLYSDAFQLSSLKSNVGSDDADLHGDGIDFEPDEDEIRKGTTDVNDDDTPFVDKRPTFSEDTHRRITERHREEQELVDLIKSSEKVKAHLKDVLLGKTTSTYHSKFHKPGKTRAEDRALKTLGFGPIESELHIAELTRFLQRQLCTMKCQSKQNDDIYYLTDVWLPEATIFGIHLQRNISLEEAEKLFARGVDYTSEEMAVFTNDMIANTTDEDRAEQRARTKRILANNRLERT